MQNKRILSTAVKLYKRNAVRVLVKQLLVI